VSEGAPKNGLIGTAFSGWKRGAQGIVNSGHPTRGCNIVIFWQETGSSILNWSDFGHPRPPWVGTAFSGCSEVGSYFFFITLGLELSNTHVYEP